VRNSQFCGEKLAVTLPMFAVLVRKMPRTVLSFKWGKKCLTNGCMSDRAEKNTERPSSHESHEVYIAVRTYFAVCTQAQTINRNKTISLSNLLLPELIVTFYAYLRSPTSHYARHMLMQLTGCATSGSICLSSFYFSTFYHFTLTLSISRLCSFHHLSTIGVWTIHRIMTQFTAHTLAIPPQL
jgi:hypothetical protein